ncbi:MAG: ATP-binding protein [Sulfuricurvum sp.]|nr:ATP-binding protein [Sulfuricurvum sp.]
MISNGANSKSRCYVWGIGVVFVLFATVFGLYAYCEKAIDIANDERVKSYELSKELEESSDNLTRMVRSYVSTGDVKYKIKYNEILNIRNGVALRPAWGDNLYVELSTLKAQQKIRYSKAQPLMELIKKSGFTPQEVAKMEEAKYYSDVLTTTERKAMELAEHSKQEKALALIYGMKYDEAKARIMLPILEVNDTMIKRTKEKVDDAMVIAKAMLLLFVFIGMVLFFLLFRAYTLWTKLYHELNEEKHNAEAAKEAKGSFMANMSHEIRTPLNGIVGFVNLLSKSPLNSEQARYIGIVQNSIDSLMVIVNDILDFSKIAEGKKEVELLEINPKVEFEKAFMLFEPIAKDKQIVYEMLLDSALSPCVKMDLFMIKQVMLNLINNAIKFTPEKGNITISVAVSEDQYTQQRVLFDVEDTGPGMSEAAQVSIFERFTQADISTTRTHGGTGLGLSIAYSLVEMMGGKLRVRSEEGKGSSFSFELKIDKCTQKVKIANSLAEKIAINDVFTAPDMRVLVAEDQDTNQMIIEEYLKRYKIHPDFAFNGEEAVALAHKNVYDLILMDINMPIMDGMEATGLIKKTYPDLLIVALTANALEGDYEKFMKAGMNEYLTKPINVPALEAILRHVRGLKNS